MGANAFCEFSKVCSNETKEMHERQLLSTLEVNADYLIYYGKAMFV